MIPNIPFLCETRWTAKYKSIRVFCDNFDQIFTQLDVLSNEANGNTRQLAHQMLLASSSTTFLFRLIIISFYSALLELCTQALQAIQLDLPQVQRHIHELLLVINLHCNKANMHFSADIYKRVIQLSGKLNIQLTPPRQCLRQLYRNNSGARDTNVEEYFRQAMYIPYLDSLIDSLQTRFSEDKIAQFNFCLLHPAKMRTLTREKFIEKMSTVNEVYKIDNFKLDSVIWFDFWAIQSFQNTINEFTDLLPRTVFYPAVREALLILITLPTTTCIVERSFSTLRRVKTSLRSTMSNERLSGLCMLSMHREKICSRKSEFMEQIVNKFGSERRQLQFLFTAFILSQPGSSIFFMRHLSNAGNWSFGREGVLRPLPLSFQVVNIFLH